MQDFRQASSEFGRQQSAAPHKQPTQPPSEAASSYCLRVGPARRSPNAVRPRRRYCWPAAPRRRRAMVSGRRNHPTAALPARMAPAMKIIPISACTTWVATAPVMNSASPNPARPRTTGISSPTAPANSSTPDTGTNHSGIPQAANLSIHLAGSRNLPAPNITNTTAKTTAPPGQQNTFGFFVHRKPLEEISFRHTVFADALVSSPSDCRRMNNGVSRQVHPR